MSNKISFTAFIVKIIKNTSNNYKKKMNYISKREIQITENLGIERVIKNAEIQIDDEALEKIEYLTLEKIFTRKEYYDAMKKLENREKLVLYLTAIRELPLKRVAIMLKTNENNISKIKYRAKNKFLKNLEIEGDANG